MTGILTTLVVLVVGWVTALAAEALGQRPLGGVVKVAAICGAVASLVSTLQAIGDWLARMGDKLDRIIHLGGITP